MSEQALSPGSSSAPPASSVPPPASETGSAAPDAISEALSAPTIDTTTLLPPKPKKAKPKRKPTAAQQARAEAAAKEEIASLAGEEGQDSPAPTGASVAAPPNVETGGDVDMGNTEQAIPAGVGGEAEPGAEAGPSLLPTSVKKPARAPARRTAARLKNMEGHHLLQYTNAFVPASVNIKNPAGDFVQRDSNVDVIRQVSQARARLEKETAEAEKAAAAAIAATEGVEPVQQANALNNVLIIHPGSRNLRIGRATDYYPTEVPNCIARPSNSVNWGRDAPVPGSRVKRLAARAEEERHSKRRKKENGHAEANGTGEADGDVKMDGNSVEGAGHEDMAPAEDEDEEILGEDWQNPVDSSIHALREYLKEHLRLRRLSTNFDEVRRIRAANSRIKPENIPEHNDPFRIDWTEVEGKPFFVGTEALRLPPTAGFSVRYPICKRKLNTRDWSSSQLLMDDIGLIILETLRTELGILPKDLKNYSVVLVVPDHGDRFYVQEMTSLLMGTMGFKEIAIHQESFASIFCAGISTSCVVDVGASRTSITCVDEGLVVQDSRVVLNYGGDDVTIALMHLLERAAFPYKELDLARPQDWIMMDGLKQKICTLEEHLVANTAWDFRVLRPVGPTLKYTFRTFDENVLAPLTWFDTNMIDFEEKKGTQAFRIRGRTKGVTDELQSGYGETTASMRECTKHLWIRKKPSIPSAEAVVDIDAVKAEDERKALLAEAADDISAQFGDPNPPARSGVQASPAPPRIVEIPSTEPPTAAPSMAGTPARDLSASGTPVNGNGGANGIDDAEGGVDVTPVLDGASTVPSVPQPAALGFEYEMPPGFDVFKQASESALDGAIASSISQAGTENKIKAAAGNILLIGGASGLKGLAGILQDRLPHLLRNSTGINLDHVSIVPPPRNLNPAFVSWKGASVMCNLESLGDMWIRRDEWEALGARALKDRCAFL